MSEHKIVWALEIDGKGISNCVTVVEVDDWPDHPLATKAVELTMMQIGEAISLHLLRCPADVVMLEGEEVGRYPKLGGRVRTKVMSKEEYEQRQRAFSAEAAA